MIVRSRALDRGLRRDTRAIVFGGTTNGRAPCRGRLVERDRIVGPVGRDACDVGVERVDQADAGRRGIDRRLGQRVGDDHTRLVDAQMELLPASLAATAVLRRGPFTFAIQSRGPCCRR